MKADLTLQSGRSDGQVRKSKFGLLMKEFIRDKWLYLMMLPGVAYFLIFKYVPMYGLIMAFQDYKPHLGFMESPWVGLKHFERFFSEPQFGMLFRNTIIIAIYNLVFFFPLPIILSLMMNELRRERFKRFVQTLIYIPHFVSWVVVVGIFYMLLTTENGILNELIYTISGKKIAFLLEPEWFRTMIISQSIWKEVGWGTIIFLAALSGVDMQLYEAVRIDGAGRWRQLLAYYSPCDSQHDHYPDDSSSRKFSGFRLRAYLLDDHANQSGGRGSIRYLCIHERINTGAIQL